MTKADNTILSELEYNPRITARKLAKLCRLSKDAIRYRIKRLEELKIISGYSIIVDHTKLGFQSYKLYLRVHTTREKREKLIRFLRNEPHIFAIFESTGNWDIAAALFFKNHNTYRTFESNLLTQFGDLILERKFCTMIDAEIYERKEKIARTQTLWGETKQNSIDQYDVEILQILYGNSSESLLHIAQKLDLSLDTIKKRIAKLQEKGIICCMKTKINFAKLGYTTYKILVFPKSFSAEKQIANYLKNKTEILNCIRTIGPWNIEIEAKVKNYAEVEALIFNLNEKFFNQIEKFEISPFTNEELFFNKQILN